MGQILPTASMQKPPEHRPGEHFLPYDANAWRRLSSTYLNQMISTGKLTKNELEIIELERYWLNRRKANYRRSYSLSPVEQQRKRHGRAGGYRSMNSASSLGNLANISKQNRPTTASPVLRNFQQSSHITRKGDNRYHSLVNVSSIKPTKDQIKNLASNLAYPDDRYSDRNHQSNHQQQQKTLSPPVRTFRNEHFSPPYDSSFSSYDSSNQSSLVNQQPHQQRHGRFERNKFANKTLINPTTTTTLKSGHDNGKIQNNFQNKNDDDYSQKYPANFRFPNHSSSNREQPPKKFQEYCPTKKSALKQSNGYTRNDNVDGDGGGEQDPFLRDNHDDKQRLINNDSPDSGFIRNDSIRTTGDQRNFQTDPLCQSNERLVEKQRQRQNKFDSSFKRRQQQSYVPDFRINSQEHLDQSYRSIPQPTIDDFQVINDSTNRVHFDDFGQEKKHRPGSAQLMRHYPNNQNNNIDRFRYSIEQQHPSIRTNYADYYQRFDRPQLIFSKIIYIMLLILNICLVIWTSIYMHFASIKIKLGEPINGRLYSMTHIERHLWQAIVIAILSLNCLTTMVAIYATIRQKYWPIFITTILFFLIGGFGANSEFLRGSISAWLLPLFCGNFGIILTHQLAINHYSI
uniref:Uncharacterized protein LOC113798145 n=1 Tax=Dermatophagoides pteronyssinus TaxID=6956 RepID=A0A6P6YG12_DERPT|nr:uncharacterized protein LOC113798145 [Dermatophagoides pteronyssinus]